MKLRVTGLLDHTVCASTIFLRFFFFGGGGWGVGNILRSSSVPNGDSKNDLFKYNE